MATTTLSFGQGFIPGTYESGLKLSLDNNTHIATGFFENYSGWDEKTKRPTFSCIFYLHGRIKGRISKIETYFPDDSSKDLITGTIEIIDSITVKIKLRKDHGGCWNIQKFTGEAVDAVEFRIENKANWVQIRYVRSGKAFFYKDGLTDQKLKSYLI